MSRSMERVYAYYRLQGTNVHVLCPNIEGLKIALENSDVKDWDLVGVYDVTMTKDKEKTRHQDMLEGMRELLNNGTVEEPV